jgi:hypothetical protein
MSSKIILVTGAGMLHRVALSDLLKPVKLA